MLRAAVGAPNVQRDHGGSDFPPLSWVRNVLPCVFSHSVVMFIAPWWLEPFRKNDQEAMKFRWLVTAQDEGKRGLQPWRQSWAHPQLC